MIYELIFTGIECSLKLNRTGDWIYDVDRVLLMISCSLDLCILV